MKHLYVLVALMLLLSFPAAAQDLREMQVSEVPPAEQKQVVVLDPNESILVVYTTLPDISFDSNLGIIRPEEPFPGIYYLHLNPGTNMITFQAKGFLSLQQTIYIDRKQSKQVKVTAAAGIISGRGSLRLETEPSGAAVIMNNIKSTYKTPSTVENQVAGIHSIRLELNGYLNVDTMLTVIKDKTTTYRLKLPRAFARLKVASDPSGATVYLDGDSIGITPLERYDLSPGDGVLLLQLDGYIANTQTVRLTVGEPRTFKVDLFPQTGMVEITTSPVGAEIFLDGQSVGTCETIPLVLDKQKIGRHVISATLAGYADTTASFETTYNKTSKINLILRAKPGALFVNSTPNGALIVLDGYDTGQRTPAKLLDVSAGQHELILQLKGYADQRSIVSITPTKTETVNEKLTETGSPISTTYKKNKRVEQNRGTSEQLTQRSLMGIRAGFNLSRYFLNEGPYTDQFKNGLNAALFFNYKFTKILSFQFEISYNQKGAGMETQGIKTTHEVDYLEFPLLLKLNGSSNASFSPNLFFGPYFGTNQKARWSYDSPTLQTEVISGRLAYFKSYDIGGVVGGGVDIDTGPGMLILDVRYSVSFASVTRMEPSNIYNLRFHHHVFCASIGYAVKI